MPNMRIYSFAIIGLIALSLTACGGGGGQGYRVEDNPVKVGSTTLPPMTSGDSMDYVIPLEGGCGGPYVLQVIEGSMPAGLDLDNDSHAITGYVLEAGDFDFTIQVTDTGCQPYSSTTAVFAMDVPIGAIRIVDVRKDGNPSAFVPEGEGTTEYDGDPNYVYNPDYVALPDTIFNQFTNVEFVVGGGKAPYTIELVDAPGIDDGPLPLGVAPIPGSTSLSGTPIEEASPAFLVSLQVKDSLGALSEPFTYYWLVFSPPLFLLTDDIDDGQVGIAYADEVVLAGGIPPFEHMMVETSGAFDTEMIDETIYNNYASMAPGDEDYRTGVPGTPPEGFYVTDDTGFFRGIPRRPGMYRIYYLVQSAILPSLRQKQWATFDFDIAAAATAFVQDPSYTVEGSFSATPPYSRLPEILKGSIYNPDDEDPDGLQCLASGGCPFDGLPDFPHRSQIDAFLVANPGYSEPDGYNWTAVWDAPGIPAGVDYSDTGLLSVTDDSALVKQSWMNVHLTASEASLPVAATESQWARVAIGPDAVLVSVSQSVHRGHNGTYDGGVYQIPHSYYQPARSMNDVNMDIRRLSVSGTGALAALSDTADLVAGSSLPPTTDGVSLNDMLTTVDLLRVSTNPTGWWDDSYNLNPASARGMQHGDANKVWAKTGNHHYMMSGHYQYHYYYPTTDGMEYSYSYGSYYSYYAGKDMSVPESTSVHLPDCTSDDVTASVSAGIYKDGGRMYAFDSPTHFGLFVVRNDGLIYVPTAFDKDASTWEAFGDNWHYDHSLDVFISINQRKIPQMTVSPDGRFAAMKLMTKPSSWGTSLSSSNVYSHTYGGDTASVSKVVIFSLTGEKLWGGQPYTIVSSGAPSSGLSGTHLLATSLTLTNKHLYYICANRGSYDTYSWREQFVYRYTVEGGGTTASLLGSTGNGNSPAGWSDNLDGTGMQMPSGRFDSPSKTGIVTGSTSTSGSGQYSYYRSGYYAYTTSATKYEYYYFQDMARRALNSDGMNWHEGSAAPSPFRVNKDGNACVIIAGDGPASTTSSSGTDFFMHNVFLDYRTTTGTTPTLYRLSSKARHVKGAARGTRLTDGPNNYTTSWGARTGPSTAVEISDDAMKVAVVVSRDTGYIYNTYGRSYSYSPAGYSGWNERQDVILFQPTGATWANVLATGEDEIQVTGSETNAAYNSVFRYYGSSFSSYYTMKWRFGGLAFTQDSSDAKGGLLFWGGVPKYDADYYTGSTSPRNYWYVDSFSFTGSVYAYKFDDNKVYNTLDDSIGGANLTVGVGYESDISYSASTTSQGPIGTSWWSTSYYAGSVKPVGGFRSANGKYMYIANMGALASTTTYRENMRLLGWNVEDLDFATQTTSDRYHGLGFTVGSPSAGSASDTWPLRTGFTVCNGGQTTSYQDTRAGIAPSYYYTPVYSPTSTTSFTSSFGFYMVPGVYSTSYPYIGQWNAPAGIYGSEVVMSENGWVFFAGHHQPSTSSSSTSTYYYPNFSTYFSPKFYGPYAGELYVFDADVGGPVHKLSTIGGTRSTSYSSSTPRYLKYIETTDDGSCVAYVYSQKTSTSRYRYPVAGDREQLGLITNLALDPDDGTLIYRAVDNTLAPNWGRVSSSVGIAGTKDGVYFGTNAAVSSSSSEKDKELYLQVVGATVEKYGFGKGRYNVLHATR